MIAECCDKGVTLYKFVKKHHALTVTTINNAIFCFLYSFRPLKLKVGDGDGKDLFKDIFEVYYEVLMNKLLVSIMHCIILAMYSNCNKNINIYFHNKLRELRP